MRALVALAALVLVVLAFVALAPATLLDARIAAMTHDKLRLADAAGTVWTGSGALCDARGRWRVPLAWHVSAPAALRGALRIELQPDARSTARGIVTAYDDTLDLASVHLELPAAAIETAWAGAVVPRFEGVIVADTPSLRTDGAHVDGGLDVRWDRARIAVAGIAVDLGSVEAQARPASVGTTVTLRNRGGDVALEGEVHAERDTVALDATLTPAPTLPQPALVALRALGPTASDGSVHVTWRGRR